MKPIVRIPKCFYGINGGDFGYFNSVKMLIWHSCREQFHTNCPRPKRLVHALAHQDAEGKPFGHIHSRRAIIGFVRHAERILHVGYKYRCRFIKSNNRYVLAVVPGKFWGTGNRLTLLTILLRAGRLYRVDRKGRYNGRTDDNGYFWKAARKNDYLYNTWDAFRKFMNGNTKIDIRDFGGWVDEFAGHNGEMGVGIHKLVQSEYDEKRLAVKRRISAR
jgi:hypothetical protein